MADKPKPRGRPSHALTETSVLIKLPALLRLAAAESARRNGVSVREWWRNAASFYLASGAPRRDDGGRFS